MSKFRKIVEISSMSDDIGYHSDQIPSISTDFHGTIFVLATLSGVVLYITPLNENLMIIDHDNRGLLCEGHFSEI